MKANEYIKKYDVDCAKEILKHNQDLMNIGFFIDLKRLVESHELIESCGGLQSVGEKLTHGMYESRAVIERLEQAILDVESCQ